MARLDFIGDSGYAEVYRLSQEYNFPQYVKQANPNELFEPPTNPDVCAYPIKRQFPCNTKAAAWLSALFFAEKKAEFDIVDQQKIAQRIDHYAKIHGIFEDVQRIKQRWGELRKTAEEQLPDSAFAYVGNDANGKHVRKLPLTSPLHAKLAAEWLAKNADTQPTVIRREIANNILDAVHKYASAVNPDVYHTLEKLAGNGFGDRDEIISMLEVRGLKVGDQELKEKLAQVISAVKTIPDLLVDQGSMVRLVDTVDMIDRCIKLASYSPMFPRPEDVVFKYSGSQIEKEAETMCRLITGKVYDKTAFARLRLSDIRDYFGDDVYNNVRTGVSVDPEKMAEEAEILPRPDAELLEKLLDEVGVRPSLHSKSAQDHLLTKELIDQYAAIL